MFVKIATSFTMSETCPDCVASRHKVCCMTAHSLRRPIAFSTTILLLATFLFFTTKFAGICLSPSRRGGKVSLEFFPRAVPDQHQCRPRFSVSGSNLTIVLYKGSIFISTLLPGY